VSAAGRIRVPRLPGALRAAWAAIRAATGDDAYERYLAHHYRHHPEAPPLSRRDWFARETERRFSGVTRCC
jgi:uncharacterized short protein YbdD (DUF466 family)